MDEMRRLRKKLKRILFLRKAAVLGLWALLGILWPKLMGPQVLAGLKHFL